jgi:hypothetical protein
MSPQQQRLRAAFLNALARPDMPIEPQFSTGSAAGDEQAMLRARYARMLDAGRSAVAERAAAQGRSLQTGADGMPVYGDAPATPIVQESSGGVRVAYRNGMPVGFSTPQPTAPFVGEAQQVIPTATRLAADQSVARMRVAQLLRAAGATAPAVAAAEGSPAAAPAVQATAAPIRAGLSPVTGAVSADGSTYSATGLPVLRPGSQPVVEEQVDGEIADEAEVLAAAQNAEAQEAVSATQAEQRQEKTSFDAQKQVILRQIAQATRRGDIAAIRRLRSDLSKLEAKKPGGARVLEQEQRLSNLAESLRGL